MIGSILKTSLSLTALTALLIPLACSGTPKPVGDNPNTAANPNETLIFSYPGDLPKWAHQPGVEDNKEYKHFTGISRKFATEADARQGALDNARMQVADYLSTDVKRLVREVTAYVGASSEILDPGTVSDSAVKLATDVTVLGTAAKLFYAEKWQTQRADNASYWKVYVSVPLPRAAQYDLALGDLKKQLEKETDARKKQNIQRAMDRLEELKKKGWFDK